MAPASKNRVKVYHLNAEGSWEDQGTGYASIHDKCIYCNAEEGEHPILEAPISMEEIYQRQGETIISWNDPQVGMDLALSFQEAENCQVVWEELCSVQGRAEASTFRVESPTDSGVEYERGSNGAELPEPDMEHLEEIAKAVENCTVFQRDAVAQAFSRQGYVKRLLDLFSMCDDLENKEGLQALFKIFKGAIMLNDCTLLENILLSDEYLMEIVGCLEHDPELMEAQKHREFLSKTAVFKEVVPIRDERVGAKIHQNFRVSYLKDVILAKYLDDQTYASLNQLIYFNSVEIVNRLQQDAPFLDELFSRLFAPDVELDTLRDLVAFVQELCSLAKNLQMMSRNQFYRALTDRDLFKLFETFLVHKDIAVRLSTIDIIKGFLDNESSVCRTVMMAQQPQCSLFGILVDQLFGDIDAGMKTQVAEVIRTILDPELMEGACEKDDFLNVFYDNYMERLVMCITAEKPVRDKMALYKSDRKQVDSDEALVAHTRNQVCEILAFCVQSHGYRIKYFILRHNIVQKALGLITPKAKASHLTMAVIRFVRACVGLKDEFYNRHMVKNNLFEPVIATFTANGSRYNLLNSAVVEMVDFIRRENIKTLVTHLVESYREHFVHVAYVSTFKDLIIRYEQNQEGEEGTGDRAEGGRSPTQGVRRRVVESDDEAYFNESDDESQEASDPGQTDGGENGPKLVQLVAYQMGDGDDNTSPSKDSEENSRTKRQKVDATST